jgi:hypothetical protein
MESTIELTTELVAQSSIQQPFAMLHWKIKIALHLIASLILPPCSFLFLIFHPFIIFYLPVPAQENECYCGIFICRYAYAMYYIRDLNIIDKDVFEE